MGVLIETGQIELVDLTDVRPAILILQASQPQVQIKKGDGSFNPDYIVNNQIITPMLHLGQEFIALSDYSDKIIYKIKDEELKKNNDGTLSINSNLPDNTTQIITAVIGELTYKDILYQNITDQIELTCLTSTSETNLQLIADGEAFTNNIQSIELTAQMYQAGKEVVGENYVWYKNGKIIEGEEGNKLTVQKGDVQSVAIFSCQVTYNGNTYKDEITINDFSDPYVGTIISSSGVIFTSANSLPTLTCDVYKGTSLVKENINYQWYVISGTSNNSIGTGKEYEVSSTQIDFSKESVTFLCRATVVETGGHNVAVDAILTLAIMGEIGIKITPRDIFLPFDPEGKYTGDIENDSYKIKCSVVDSLGRVVNNTGIISNILFGDDIKSYFSVEGPTVENSQKAEYIYTIKIKQENNNFDNFKDSNIGTFSITYNEEEFSENFYFIKNIKGSDAAQLDKTEVKYLYSNNASTNPDKVAEDEGKPYPEWYDNKQNASLHNLNNNPFLWIKTIYIFNNGENKVSYSVSDGNLKIIETKEFYALGRYFNYSLDGETYKYAILYNPENLEIWLENFPSILSYEKDANLDTTKAYIFAPIEELFSNITPIVSSGTKLFGESLWIKYKFTYEDNSTSFSSPKLAESINGFRAKISDADLIINDDNIQSIVSTTEWGSAENGNTSFISYIKQFASSIEGSVNDINNQINTYFTFDSEGLSIGKKIEGVNSPYSTLMAPDGFKIRYSGNDSAAPQTIGSFDSNGLAVSEIDLDVNKNKSRIVVVGTNTGGWSWEKKGG